MYLRSTALLTLAALFASAVLAGASAGRNSVRYSLGDAFEATGIDPDARGRVQILVKQREESALQRLRVSVARLEPNAPYELLARVGDELELASITTFTTSASGRASIVQLESRVNDKLRRNRRKAAALAQPLLHVRTLAVANSSGEIVLMLNLHESPALQFELASVFATTGYDPAAVGCFAVGMQEGVLQFRLFAVGQDEQLTLEINDQTIGTYALPPGGRLTLGALPMNAPSPLAFRKVAFRNSEDQVVLETELP